MLCPKQPAKERLQMIQVKIHSLNLDEASNQPVVVLRDSEHNRLLPIWIGHHEATAILLKLQRVDPPRPLSHDLMHNIILDLGYQVERIEITRLEETTFFAAIVLRGEEKTLAIDARPSDSIALAVRAHAPIFVADDVMEAAGLTPEEEMDEESEVEAFRDFLESVNPDDFLS
jgi:bifunctional DNase/RNase